MHTIEIFLSNPVVGLVGYLLSLIAACIAIWQFIGKSKALTELNGLKIKYIELTEQNISLSTKTNNSENIRQGKKSQYFQDNSGPVTIDNRN